MPSPGSVALPTPVDLGWDRLKPGASSWHRGRVSSQAATPSPGLAPGGPAGLLSWPKISCNLGTTFPTPSLNSTYFSGYLVSSKVLQMGQNLLPWMPGKGLWHPRPHRKSLAVSRHPWPDCVWPPGTILRQDGLTQSTGGRPCSRHSWPALDALPLHTR